MGGMEGEGKLSRSTIVARPPFPPVESHPSSSGSSLPLLRWLRRLEAVGRRRLICTE
jgi:hypothetical protein